MITEKPDFLEIKRANTGFFVLRTFDDENGRPTEIEKAPVEFWAIERDTFALYPITLEGLHADNVYILCPHGAVERVNIDGFVSQDEWLRSLQEDFDKKMGAPK